LACLVWTGSGFGFGGSDGNISSVVIRRPQ
jgi:hypothetical protein